MVLDDNNANTQKWWDQYVTTSKRIKAETLTSIASHKNNHSKNPSILK